MQKYRVVDELSGRAPTFNMHDTFEIDPSTDPKIKTLKFRSRE